MECAPADSPKKVTLLGSPPIAAIWLLTYARAGCWTSRPKSPEDVSSSSSGNARNSSLPRQSRIGGSFVPHHSPPFPTIPGPSRKLQGIGDRWGSILVGRVQNLALKDKYGRDTTPHAEGEPLLLCTDMILYITCTFFLSHLRPDCFFENFEWACNFYHPENIANINGNTVPLCTVDRWSYNSIISSHLSDL